MNLRLILPLVLLLMLCSSAGAASYDVDNASMLANFYNGSNLWMATSFLKQAATWTFVTTIIGKLAEGGIVLAIGFFLCEAARAYLSGESLELHEAFAFYGKTLLVFVVLGVAVTSGNAFANLISTIFFAPIEAITGIVKTGSSATVLKQIADSLADAAAANQDSKLKWFMKLVELDVTMLMVNFFMMFALVIAWIMSLYIGVMVAMLLALGPICIPFFLFQPVSSVGWNWVKSMIAYPMMGVVGSITTGILMTSGMLKFAVDSGAMGQNLTSIASSVILIIVMVSIPAVTSALFGGIVGSPMGAARTLTSAASTAVTAGAAAVGGALAVGGPAVARVGGMMSGSSEGSSPSGVAGAIKTTGERAGNTGRAILQSQFPGLSRMKRAMSSGGGSTFGAIPQQQSTMIDYASRTYGHSVAAAMQERMTQPAYSTFGINAAEGETKGQSVERSTREALSSMGIRPGNATTLGMADRKVGSQGFDFGFNSREANQALMADWVRKNYGQDEYRAFKERVAGNSQDLSGVTKDVNSTVGEGAMAAAASLGVMLELPKSMMSDRARDAGARKSDAGLASAQGGAPPDVKAPKDWTKELSSWDVAKQQQNMVSFVKGRYGSATADAFAEKLRSPEWAGTTIDTSTAEGTTYDAVMSPFMYSLMDRMGAKPAVASSMEELANKDRGTGWNFSMNSREGNAALMTDYVRLAAGEQEAGRFAALIDDQRDYLAGRQARLPEAVAAAVYDVYQGAGEQAPASVSEPLRAVQRVGEQKAETVTERDSYRGRDVFTYGTGTGVSEYQSWDRSQQVGYLREIARTANNGQYAQYADLVRVPDRWNPVMRDGQEFHQAALGAMRELMRRQGFIGTNKKENT